MTVYNLVLELDKANQMEWIVEVDTLGGATYELVKPAQLVEVGGRWLLELEVYNGLVYVDWDKIASIKCVPPGPAD